MFTVYAVCAAVGGTVLVCQFVLTVLGLIGDGHDGADGGHDVGDVGHDVGDASHDVAVADHDLIDVAHDVGDAGAEVADVGADAAHGGAADAHADVHHHGADWHAHHPGPGVQAHTHAPSAFFKILTFRTIVAGIAFFGLAGLAGSASSLAGYVTLPVAVGAGLGAVYLVHEMMRALAKLRSEGTVYIGRAIGATGTVYLTVPGNKTGVGKVTVVLQDRTMEYQAMTEYEDLPTGTEVVITGLLGPGTVEVELAPDAGSTEYV